MRVHRRRRLVFLSISLMLLSINGCGGRSQGELEAMAMTGVAQTAAAYTPTPPPPTPTEIPSPTATIKPTPTINRTATARSRATQTAEANPCIRWDEVDDSYFAANPICVYGRIVKLQESERYPQIVRFSNEAGTFLLWSEWFTYLGLEPGMCVAAVGYLTRDGNLFGMEIGVTKLYEYSGCE